MESQRISQRAASAKAAQMIKTTYDMWTTFDDYEEMEMAFALPPAMKEETGGEAHLVLSTSLNIDAKDKPKKFSIRDSHSLIRFERIKDSFPWNEQDSSSERSAYLRRRALRSIHSSNKFAVSRRLAFIMENSVPKLSPVKPLNLASHLKHSTVKHITRRTREGTTIVVQKKPH